VELTRHETETSAWEVARRTPSPSLAPFLGRSLEGWAQTRGKAGQMREVPFPGVPLILNLGPEWIVDGERHDSFLAGLHDRATIVGGSPLYSCIELRLSPLRARRLTGLPMHELANRAIPLEELLPGAHKLTGRLRETGSWDTRFDLVERFLARRLADAEPPSPGVVWAWRQLVASGGRESIGTLVTELGWSRRRLIAHFREEIGLAPKTAARVIRFDRSVARLRGGTALADVAYDGGYFDQAHFNREFRELAGTTPTAFVAAFAPSGAVAA
jgi:AraC-like DNA-binding protein